MIEFVFSASPETIRNGPPEHGPFAQSATGGTWQPARSCIPMFLPFHYQEKFLRSRCSAQLFGRHEILVSVLNGKHVADHFSGNG